MKVFVASSRRFYDDVKKIKAELNARGVVGFYPYFEFGDGSIEMDEQAKKNVTLRHFPEIDQVDILYIVAPAGYVGISVTLEAAYAYAKGAQIISSEPAEEMAVRAIVSKVMTPEEFVAYAST